MIADLEMACSTRLLINQRLESQNSLSYRTPKMVNQRAQEGLQTSLSFRPGPTTPFMHFSLGTGFKNAPKLTASLPWIKIYSPLGELI